MTGIEKLARFLGIDADAFEIPPITRQERTEAQAAASDQSLTNRVAELETALTALIEGATE